VVRSLKLLALPHFKELSLSTNIIVTYLSLLVSYPVSPTIGKKSKVKGHCIGAEFPVKANAAYGLKMNWAIRPLKSNSSLLI